MKAGDKAKELFNKMLENGRFVACMKTLSENKNFKATAKYCALDCVDGIIEAVEAFGYSGSMFDDYETGKITTTDENDPCKYWREVKTEIEKL